MFERFDGHDPDTAQFRIEVIKVPLSAPQTLRFVVRRASSPALLPHQAGGGPGTAALPPPVTRPRAGGAGGAAAGGADRRRNAAVVAGAPAPGGRGGGGRAPDPNQCHDITVYPAAGWLAARATDGDCCLISARPRIHPIDFAADAKCRSGIRTVQQRRDEVLFSDEWGGGSQPRWRETDTKILAQTRSSPSRRTRCVQELLQAPAAQTEFENCVAHNGSLIPIPGREVMVQAWYHGGISCSTGRIRRRPLRCVSRPRTTGWDRW